MKIIIFLLAVNSWAQTNSDSVIFDCQGKNASYQLTLTNEKPLYPQFPNWKRVNIIETLNGRNMRHKVSASLIGVASTPNEDLEISITDHSPDQSDVGKDLTYNRELYVGKIYLQWVHGSLVMTDCTVPENIRELMKP